MFSARCFAIVVAFLSLWVVVPAAQAALPFVCGITRETSLLDGINSFVLAELRRSPVEATQAGYHGDADAPLDRQLDDMSPEGIAAMRALLASGKSCFDAKKATSAEDAADLALLRESIDSMLFQLDVLQPYRYRPQDYVEMIGSGLFFPMTSSRGTPEERLTNVIARMEQIPRVLQQARANLKEADPLYIDVALEENTGDIDVVGGVAGSIPAGSPLSARYDKAADAALAALHSYAKWLRDDLARRPRTRDWRTGAANYAKVFAFALGPGTHQTPESVLAAAERDLAQVRAEMFTVALPLHKQWFGGHPDHGDHTGLSGDALQNVVIAEVIDRINQDHCEPGELLEKVKSQAGGIREFIHQKDLLTLSDRDNMRIVATPVFMRQSYSVAGFHPAPALDPAEEAEYWVTPVDATATRTQAESKLREYNNWMLQYLTMHEALPGHYTQGEHANNVQPESRRILRGLLGSGSYIEGWGEYAVKEMEDAGYAGHDPRFVLMVQKIRLRVIANAILDIRMQSLNMTDDEALELMEQKAFQTHAEAMGKLSRVKLTAGQLITYYVGYHQWIDLRARMQARQGASFSLKRFNDAALDEGALPIPLLDPLLADKLGLH